MKFFFRVMIFYKSYPKRTADTESKMRRGNAKPFFACFFAGDET